MSNAFDVTVDALRKQGLNSDEILGELSKLFQGLVDSNNESATKEDPAVRIRTLLKKLCVPVHVEGYNYWVDAILMYKQSDCKLKMMDLYAKIAQKHEINHPKVERAMSIAIKCGFGKCGEDVKEMFANNISSITGIPRNKQFLIILSEQI